MPTHSRNKQFISSFGWQIIEKFVSGFYVLFLSTLMARSYGAATYGEINYIFSLISVLLPISSMGIDIVYSNKYLKSQHYVGYPIVTPLIVKLVVSVLVLVSINSIGSLFFEDKNDEFRTAFLIYSIVLVVSSFSIFEAYLQINHKGRSIAVSRLIGLALLMPFKLLVITLTNSLVLICVTFVVEMTVIHIIQFYMCKNKVEFGRRVSWAEVKSILSEAIPLVLSSIFVVLYLRIDVLMIAEMLSEKDVGIYVAATKICEVFNVLGFLFVSVCFPYIAKKKLKHNKEYEDLWEFSFHVLTLVSLLISILYSLYSDLIITTLFGPEYSEAIAVSQVYIWSIVFTFVGLASSRYMIFESLNFEVIVLRFLGCLSNILLNYIFIPKWGILGAAYATLISYFITVYLASMVFAKTRVILVSQIKSIFYPRYIDYVKALR